jgi:hypothetical protein
VQLDKFGLPIAWWDLLVLTFDFDFRRLGTAITFLENFYFNLLFTMILKAHQETTDYFSILDKKSRTSVLLE